MFNRHDSEVKVVLNQCGAALELHQDGESPVTLMLITPPQFEQYRNQFAANNPDMRHATIGQLSMEIARRVVKADCRVSDVVWTFNASENKYYPA